jgi:DNA-binding FadR family transcriptional regulator
MPAGPLAPGSSSRRPLSAALHDTLRSEIVEGRLAPGDPLPSERSLSESQRVNRHAVREALKRLEQAGLVSVSQGGATRVRDWRVHAGLDLLVDLAASARGGHRGELVLAVAELRRSIGVDAAALCAQRAPAALGDEIVRLASLPAETRFEDRAERYTQLWSLVVDGSGNIAYRLAFNSLVAAEREGHMDIRVHAAEVDDLRAQLALAEAIAAGNARAAEARARELLDRTVAAVQPETT